MIITVKGDTNLLQNILGRIDPAIPAASAASEIQATILRNVDSGRDPYGVPFAPHSPKYRRRGGGNPPYKFLNWTGKMLGSFKTDTNKQGLRAVATISNTSRVFGYHQLGTRFIPARKMLGTPAEFVNIAMRHTNDYLRGLL